MSFLDRFPLNKSISALDTKINGAIVGFERAHDVAQKIAMDAIKKTPHLPDYERKSLLKKLKNLDVHGDTMWKGGLSFQQAMREISLLPPEQLQKKINQFVVQIIKNVLSSEQRIPAEFDEARESILKDITTKLQTL